MGVSTRAIIFAFAFAFALCGTASAQSFGRKLNKTVENAAERATLRKAEQKTDEAVSKSIDKATDANTYKDNDGDKKESKPAAPANAPATSTPAAAPAAEAKPAAPKEILKYSGIAPATHLFFPAKVGTVQVYVQKNDKGKIDTYTKQTIREVEGGGDNLDITYVAEVLDKDRKSLSETPYEVTYMVSIRGGVISLDLKSLFGGGANTGQEQMMEITGDPMELPSTIAPGETLKDVKMSMTLNLGFKIKTDLALTDGKCLAIEDVTTPAGTFKCHKITQTSTATAMRKTVVTRTVTWYAPGTGSVKAETYDDKGKLQSSTELVEMN